jgi:hypothetical protein
MAKKPHAWKPKKPYTRLAARSERLEVRPYRSHRIEASCDPRNKASAKTALRAGLKPEGVRRKFRIPGEVLGLLVFAENQIDYRKSPKRGPRRGQGRLRAR